MKLIFLICLAVTVAHASHHASNCAENRRAIVHLFEWKWNDIARECETFLGPRGYCGVQVSPPNENVVIGVDEGSTEPPRPWWERYQPVSYELETRSGSHEQFVDMVQRCNNVGVRIYVDAIINHMSGMGRSGYGTGGTFFDADAGEFPGVPYVMSNFNDCSDCPECCCINAWTDTTAVRNCRLVGLIDLKQSLSDTHDKIVAYLNKLIDIGVAGFRVDAAKHMWPDDMESIFNACNDLNTEFFDSGSRPFVFLEVIDYNQQGEVSVHEYTHIGRVTEFRFCTKVGNAASALWQIPGIYDPGWGMCAPEDAFTFVDNHDNQRGHGGGDASVTHKDPHRYKIAQAISLGYDYGWPRVMSSYDFGDDTDTGPPHDEDYNTDDVVIGEDGQCANGWICEHRWTAIAGMAGFAKATNGMSFDNWVNSGNKAAWSRGGQGFIAISNEGEWSGTFQTGMPAGQYCNVIQGCATSSGCVGDTITVNSDGSVSITVPSGDEPMIAIHVEAPAGSNQCVNNAGPPDGTTSAPGMTTEPGGGDTTTTATTTTTTASTTTTEGTTSSGATTTTASTTTTGGTTTTTTTTAPPDGNWQNTIVYMYHETSFGNDLFIRGTFGSNSERTCNPDVAVDACAVEIIHKEQSGSHFDKYSAWAEGDTHLDWYGAEPGQGSYQGTASSGTPMFWTTNQESNPGYQPDNEWGDNWWKVEFHMNCDETEDGWFELKGFGSGAGWESDISQPVCGGAGGQTGSPPYSSNNHFGLCGHRNIFSFDSNDCTIEIIN